MTTVENEKIVRHFYYCLNNGKVEEALGLLDEYITWIEPGAPDVPFGGIFSGTEGIMKMFGTELKKLQLAGLIPKDFFAAKDLVVVLGSDSATVLETGKTYNTDWTMFFTISEGRISRVQTYMDTNAIAKAFVKD
jgi:uncharacterized protein